MGVIVITGASQGIGAAIAEEFARGGKPKEGRLALVARSEENLCKVAARSRKLGAGDVEVYPCDLTQDEAVEQTTQKILAAQGVPGVLVNNAGLFEPAPFLDTTPELFRGQLAVNLTSAFLMTRALLPAMLKKGTGHVVYVASVASQRAFPGAAAYCAAKHGLLGLARCVREETKDHGIRVTAVMPGATLTPSWDGTNVDPERLMPAADVARAVVDVCRLGEGTVVEELTLRPQHGDV